ncbi:extended synaptotagmin-2-like isoform X1 [Anopheles albimanus]|uniref:extended synaptotagmin-2-like isoform X1 n=2 Tax=Anopheles albimanus TaxID=7167 RepID=UPI00163E942D|nr:extended synaptotagmin-2-like isoform X1 [Anopheles albimanus]XP_035781379.1 extended synaptotagmin-2-like isoform X1 [Anopheles albimanus]XP_035781380.1 extended synaptotagmin-2-like isoform X1 [Anopheles albimanus]XP_035781381.1 extended synaptotagmin-2-like isoform X1 [Anopheles albimanus]XP_035781382.1 extended synaptotagmin-2-like isoform X1 [Anopheles albimanus]XP_035781383.1 extended synaptotagmin-2-like isoform X1 [Anopheles albimanus]XP_035781384.1 extended synaptotagmin-2-like is
MSDSPASTEQNRSPDSAESSPLLPSSDPKDTANAADITADSMAGASKELNPDSPTAAAAAAEGALTALEASGGNNPKDDSIMSLLYSFAKKVVTVGIIYFVGYMGWSVAWLITPVILSVARESWRKKSDTRRTVAKASALANDKDVILARLHDLPAWVFFPDVERCEWLNKILKQVWPNANFYAKNLIKESIEPNIQQAMAGYKLNGFKFDRMILGTIPPRIGGVKVYDKNVSRNEIIMDLDLFYAGDCDISFALSGLRGGIKDFQIHGTVRVIMKPLISQMPLIGGLQIFFLNNPNIDFNLVGVVDLLDMPGLSDILRKIIVDQVAAIMVLPNKLPIVLSDGVPALSLKMPEPEGVLRIHVVEAKDLMKKDISMLGKGKSDPYAIISVGAQQFRTQTIDNTVNPKWDYWCEAEVNAILRQEIELNLWDWDPGFPGVQNDDFLGRATVEISSVTKNGEIDTWLTLEQAKHGLVHLRMTWFRLSSNKADLRTALEETQHLRVTSMSTALLTVFIDSAKNLPQARQQSQPDPYLVLSVGKKTEQTSVQMRTDAPVWEQGFTFLVGNPDNDTFQLKVIDQKTGNTIGTLTYILSALMEKKNLEIMSQPFQLQKSGPESKILMSLSLRILKRHQEVEVDGQTGDKSPSSETDSGLTRSSSVRAPSLSQSASQQATSVEAAATESGLSHQASIRKQESRKSNTSAIVDQMLIQEEPFAVSTVNAVLMSTPPRSPNLSDGGTELLRRSPSTTSSAGSAGLGRIQLTTAYSVQRQRLIVIVHKINNIPLKDPNNIPDPYVKLYLLPGRSKESKRKTNVVKDNCDPVFDTTFEYIISNAELVNSELEVTVCTQKGFFGSPVIGMQKLSLNDPEISSGQGIRAWYDLLPESKFE